MNTLQEDFFITAKRNGHLGDILSICLITPTQGQDEAIYYEGPRPAQIAPEAKDIVKELIQQPLSIEELQQELEHHILPYDRITLIAYDPAAVATFCELLMTDYEETLQLPEIRIVIDPNLTPTLDARDAFNDALNLRAEALGIDE